MAVRDRSAQPFDLLPRSTKADGADTQAGCFAYQGNTDRTRALADQSVAMSGDHRRVDQVEISLWPRRPVAANDVKRPLKQGLYMFGRIADRRR